MPTYPDDTDGAVLAAKRSKFLNLHPRKPRLESCWRIDEAVSVSVLTGFHLIENFGMRSLLALHAILLLLVSTSFTIVTALIGEASLQWCYFRYASSNHWGVKYVSDYSAPEIFTYLLAFTVGAVGFFAAMKSRQPVVGVLGVILSLIGILSFAIEGSHWFVDHNRSWLAFSPAVMFALVLLACHPQRVADDENSKPTTMRSAEGTT